VIRELLADLVAEEDMPKGDKPQFIGIADPLHAPGTAKGGELQRRAIKSAPLPKVLEPGERTVEKPVYKAGWAKPKKKVVIAGVKPIKRAPKSIETKMIGPDPHSPRGAKPSTAAKSFGAKAAGGVASARSFDKAGGKPAPASGFERRSAEKAWSKPSAGKPAGSGGAKPFARSGGKPSRPSRPAPVTSRLARPNRPRAAFRGQVLRQAGDGQAVRPKSRASSGPASRSASLAGKPSGGGAKPPAREHARRRPRSTPSPARRVRTRVRRRRASGRLRARPHHSAGSRDVASGAPP
jgi:23S rRNA pseudouridine2605 synthase